MSIITKDVIFTDSALAQIYCILSQEEDKSALFRVKVEGGGCSGFQYCFDVDSNVNKESAKDLSGIEEGGDSSNSNDDLLGEDEDADHIVKDSNNNPIAVIDEKSIRYLKGCTVDYIEDLTKSSFVVHNPNAKSKCGCGNSFSLST